MRGPRPYSRSCSHSSPTAYAADLSQCFHLSFEGQALLPFLPCYPAIRSRAAESDDAVVRRLSLRHRGRVVPRCGCVPAIVLFGWGVSMLRVLPVCAPSCRRTLRVARGIVRLRVHHYGPNLHSLVLEKQPVTLRRGAPRVGSNERRDLHGKGFGKFCWFRAGIALVSRWFHAGFARFCAGFAPVLRRFRAGFARFRGGIARFRRVSPIYYRVVSQGIARYRDGFAGYRESYFMVETGYIHMRSKS